MSPPSVYWADPSHLSTGEIEAWSDLAARASEPNPFFEAPFVLAAVRHLKTARVRLLVLRDAQGWQGLLPVSSRRRWRHIPVPVTGSWLHEYAYLGTPLVAAGREAEIAAGLIRALRPWAGIAALDRVCADGPVGEALEGARERARLRSTTWHDVERAFLVRREVDDYVESVQRSKRRRELRRQRAALATALDAELVTVDRAGEDAAVEAFLALEAAGWKGRAGTALSIARADGFFRHVCRAYAADGRLQLLSLEAAGTSVAMKCNLLAGDGVFCLKIAHDETYAKHSPGVQLEIDNVHVFHGRPELAWMDSCADPDNTMINRLWPDRRRLVTRLLTRQGLLGLPGQGEARAARAIRLRTQGGRHDRAPAGDRRRSLHASPGTHVDARPARPGGPPAPDARRARAPR